LKKEKGGRGKRKKKEKKKEKRSGSRGETASSTASRGHQPLGTTWQKPAWLPGRFRLKKVFPRLGAERIN